MSGYLGDLSKTQQSALNELKCTLTKDTFVDEVRVDDYDLSLNFKYSQN